jgi:hypothetical protein
MKDIILTKINIKPLSLILTLIQEIKSNKRTFKNMYSKMDNHKLLIDWIGGKEFLNQANISRSQKVTFIKIKNK